jgi:hypothetical protein
MCSVLLVFLSDFAVSALILHFRFLYSITQHFTVLNIKCSCIWVINVHAEVYRLLLCLQDIFIHCVIQNLFSLPICLYLIGKLASKIFRNVDKNKWNLLFASLPVCTYTHVSLFWQADATWLFHYLFFLFSAPKVLSCLLQLCCS